MVSRQLQQHDLVIAESNAPANDPNYLITDLARTRLYNANKLVARAFLNSGFMVQLPPRVTADLLLNAEITGLITTLERSKIAIDLAEFRVDDEILDVDPTYSKLFQEMEDMINATPGLDKVWQSGNSLFTWQSVGLQNSVPQSVVQKAWDHSVTLGNRRLELNIAQYKLIVPDLASEVTEKNYRLMADCFQPGWMEKLISDVAQMDADTLMQLQDTLKLGKRTA